MTVAPAAATAAAFVWLGMVAAICFMEAPLKFRAPEVTVRIGLGVGRRGFRALNTAEAILAAVLVAAAVSDLPPQATAAGAVAVAALAVQLAVVRPRLTRRTDRVLAGEHLPRSSGHYLYVALELVKVAALLAAGILLLAR